MKSHIGNLINIANIEPTKANFGDWEITKDGGLLYVPRDYYIAKDRLTEPFWITHLAGKVWIDFNEFIPAYFQALRNAGINQLNITTHY